MLRKITLAAIRELKYCRWGWLKGQRPGKRLLLPKTSAQSKIHELLAAQILKHRVKQMMGVGQRDIKAKGPGKKLPETKTGAI